MTGDLFKKILPLLLIINVYILSNTLNEQNYIFTNFIPYQESKTFIGVKISDISNGLHQTEESFLVNNWFTNNLYVNGSISLPSSSFNDMKIKYSTSIGYVYNIDYQISKSIVSVLGYNRIRFRNSESDNKNMSYNLLFNMKFKPFWVSLSYGIIDYDDRIENFSINFLSSVFDSFILNFGFQYTINNQDDLLTKSISLGYKI